MSRTNIVNCKKHTFFAEKSDLKGGKLHFYIFYRGANLMQLHEYQQTKLFGSF